MSAIAKTFSISDIKTTSRIKSDNYVDKDTLSFRLQIALRSANLSQSELARLIGVKPQVIQYLCQKNIKSSRFTYSLADALEVNHDWLAAGLGPMYPTHYSQQKQYQIPIITWNKLAQYLEQKIVASNNINYITSSTNQNNFAVLVEDDSMEPRIGKGTILIVAKQKKYQSNDFVIAKIEKYNTYIFRQYVIENNEEKLIPFNFDLYKSITLTEKDAICGKIVQTIYNFTRD